MSKKKESKKPRKVQLTALQTIRLWNLMNNKIYELSDNPALTGWWKRLSAYMKPEVMLWNSLTEAEREPFMDSKLQFPVDKLPAQHLPDIITEDEAELLKLVTEGEIIVYKSQLQKLKDNVKA